MKRANGLAGIAVVAMGVVCMPLAMQLSSALPRGPAEAVWPLFVLSVWAGLFATAVLAVAIVVGCARLARLQRRSAAAWWRRCSSMKLAMK
ncbi:hypothetical protein [Pseudazoarcus pumilus]|uniref:hypothetical protein n=1 Tax=Pseudazoarcus pumilus TaxID=2067960 RepID=UPI000F4E3013|nr:hypothetical protein [Pseudazoarcus pumilus]